jgi:hypothetical protein
MTHGFSMTSHSWVIFSRVGQTLQALLANALSIGVDATQRNFGSMGPGSFKAVPGCLFASLASLLPLPVWTKNSILLKTLVFGRPA